MADTVFYNYSGKKSIREIARIAEAGAVRVDDDVVQSLTPAVRGLPPRSSRRK